MKTKKDAKTEVVEGMRARKGRQTRERIANTAMALFLERGFDGVTVDEIAATADVSKRSFFDYFSTKEDVVFAWQDEFGPALAAAVRARPAEEPLAVVVEKALTASVAAAVQAHPDSVAIEGLVRKTPVLRARDHVKYAAIEQALAEALMERVNDERGRFRARMLAVIVIGGLRIASEQWYAQGRSDPAESYTREIFQMTWDDLREFGRTALKSKKR